MPADHLRTRRSLCRVRIGAAATAVVVVLGTSYAAGWPSFLQADQAVSIVRGYDAPDGPPVVEFKRIGPLMERKSFLDREAYDHADEVEIRLHDGSVGVFRGIEEDGRDFSVAEVEINGVLQPERRRTFGWESHAFVFAAYKERGPRHKLAWDIQSFICTNVLDRYPEVDHWVGSRIYRHELEELPRRKPPPPPLSRSWPVWLTGCLVLLVLFGLLVAVDRSAIRKWADLLRAPDDA